MKNKKVYKRDYEQIRLNKDFIKMIKMAQIECGEKKTVDFSRKLVNEPELLVKFKNKQRGGIRGFF